MLALALGHRPRLLLLDDPTLGLDVVARDAVFREVIGELADRGTTVFVTTHDLRAVEGIADHVAILHEGRLALDGALEALKVERGLSLEQLFAAVAGTRAGDARVAEVRAMSRLLAVTARELRERWLLFPASLLFGFNPLVLPAFGVDRRVMPFVGVVTALGLGAAAAADHGLHDAGPRRRRTAGSGSCSRGRSRGRRSGAASGSLRSSSSRAAACWRRSRSWSSTRPSRTAAPGSGRWRRNTGGWSASASSCSAPRSPTSRRRPGGRGRRGWCSTWGSSRLSLWFARRHVAPLWLYGIVGKDEPKPRSSRSFPLAVGLFAASAAQIAVGRTDVRRAHRALSLVVVDRDRRGASARPRVTGAGSCPPSPPT